MESQSKHPKKEEKWKEELDAVSAAPNSHIVLFENDKVRVVEVVIEPTHREPYHTHKWPSVMIVNSSARIRYFDDKGRSTKYPKRDISFEKPLVEYMEPEGEHAVENIDDVTYHAFRVEIKNVHK